MVPRPVHAVLCLFPVSPASEAARVAEEAARVAAGAAAAVDPRIFFMRQGSNNSCGTIGLIHAVANASTLAGGPLALPPESTLAKFIAAHLGAAPAARATAMETDAGLEAAHGDAVQEGQSAVVDDTHLHFFCIVQKGGHLVELDGRKEAPIKHGATSDETFLSDCAAIVRAAMARDEGELRFTLLALAAPAPDEAD
jgi:ubiquitin carboxyl-terminal hydrolase L3